MATRLVTMPLLMTELSHLLGEIDVPTSGIDNRKRFLQQSLEDAWKQYPWPFSLTDDTITFSNGVASLPDDFLPEGHYYLSKNGKEVNESDYANRSEAIGTSYYIRYQDGEYQAVLLNDQDFTGEFRYQYTVPDMTTSDTKRCPYPSLTTIAMGGLRYTVKADNPEADNSQEESGFTAKVQEDYSAFNRTRTRNRRARSVMETRGHSTGEF